MFTRNRIYVAKQRLFYFLIWALKPLMPVLVRWPLAWRVRARFFRAGGVVGWYARYNPDWDAPHPAALAGPLIVICGLGEADGEERRRSAEAALRTQSVCPTAIIMWEATENLAELLRQHNAALADPFATAVCLPSVCRPHPKMIAHFAAARAAHPEADLWYADEVLMDEHDRVQDVFCKPAWDRYYYERSAYTGPCFAVSGPLLLKIIADRPDAPCPGNLFDVILSAMPRGQIGHIPAPLYSSARKIQVAAPGGNAVPGAWPSVSIIIPFRDRLDLLSACLKALYEKTEYPQWECILVDNGSRDKEMTDFLANPPYPNITVSRDSRPFNFSSLVNQGARKATGEIVLLLNNDITVIAPGWLQAMVRYARRPEVGCVGAKLLYPNNIIQHGGVLLGEGLPLGDYKTPAHAHCGWPGDSPGYFGLLNSPRTVSAVTGAALAVRRQLFLEVGGFDEDLAVAMNDVDFCLKIWQTGYHCVWAHDAVLIHHESATRKMDIASPEKLQRLKGEWALMRKKWGATLDSDPWYNPNLSTGSSYEFRDPPARRQVRIRPVNV